MRVTVLFAFVLTIAFATAGFVERQARITATGTANVTSTITNPGVGTGALSGSPHANPIRFHTFDPLAQTLGTSSTALLAVELQRLMRTFHVTRAQPLTRADCKKAGMQWNSNANVCGEVGGPA
jgi:hypothetical protein